MSVSLRIEKVEVVEHNKDSEVINMVYIRLVGKPKEQSIGRKFSQFLTDLHSSYLLPKSVVSMEDTRVLKVLRKLKGGSVSGDIKFHKAGDEYVLDANHPLLKVKPGSPNYGKYVAGQKMVAEKDGARVIEGFLELDFSADTLERDANAEFYAERKVALDSLLKSVSTSTGTNKKVVETEDFDIEEEIKATSVGEQK